MKPLIGISADRKREESAGTSSDRMQQNSNYAEAVVAAGGVPVLIPDCADMHEIASAIDGWLIPGGLDIDAKNWDADNHEKAVTIPAERFDGEKRLMDAISPEMPVLGICYGCQFVNVARGGSLHQHLPDVLGHDRHTGGTLQNYELRDGSQLATLLGKSAAEGKSYHHQAIDRVGEGLKVVATDDENVVEAIEATDRPWMIGVQWHPERTQDDPAMQLLFRSFVDAAKEYARSRRR
jgi:putative glutamine amidotransferase